LAEARAAGRVARAALQADLLRLEVDQGEGAVPERLEVAEKGRLLRLQALQSAAR